MSAKNKAATVGVALAAIGIGWIGGQITKDNPDAVTKPVASYADQLTGLVHTGVDAGGKILGEGANVLSSTGQAVGGAANAVTTTGVPAAPTAGQ